MSTRAMTLRNVTALRNSLGSKLFDRTYRFLREEAMRSSDGTVRTFAIFEVR